MRNRLQHCHLGSPARDWRLTNSSRAVAVQRINRKFGFENIISRGENLLPTLDNDLHASKRDTTVLVCGETLIGRDD
jgi:transcriptional regulator with PAS, ATPase and Fis domain